MGEGRILSITKTKMCLFKMQSGITCYSGFMKKTGDGYDYEVMIAFKFITRLHLKYCFTLYMYQHVRTDHVLLLTHRAYMSDIIWNWTITVCVFRLLTSQQNVQNCMLNPHPEEASLIIQLCQYHHLLHLQLKVCIIKPQLFISCKSNKPFKCTVGQPNESAKMGQNFQYVSNLLL